MRPCDDTFGLVRGNRRKAVFAFKGLFTEGICPYSLLGSGLLSRISEVRGKIETCRAHSDFCQQNRRSQESKTGVRSAGLIFFTALPSSPVDNVRRPLESPSTTAFPHKGSAGRSIAAFPSARHARDLPHTSEFWALYPLLQMLQTLD